MSSQPSPPVALAWLFLCLAGTGSARAEPNTPDAAAVAGQGDSSAEHMRSKESFDRGVRLFQNGNVIGALAEFRAAYAIHPNSAALQNIALCQKTLFRYGAAKKTLTALLARHERELSAAERNTILATINELSTHIGTVKLSVEPATAQVSLDGSALDAQELSLPLELDVGEHHLHLEAVGYEPTERVLSIAGGSNAPQSISLKPTHGFLTVLAPDARSAIAIDGRAVAFDSYTGALVPGRHVIQVYRSGYEPYEAIVELEAGQAVTIRGKLGDPIEEDDEEPRAQQPVATPTRQLRGWYGLLDISVLNWVGAPEFIDASGHNHLGYGYALHAGYRLFTPIGVEAVIGATHHDVTGNCETYAPRCGGRATAEAYQLDTRRAGGAMRLMSGGEKLRFTSSVGMGAVSHDLRVFGMQPKGFDAYFSLEAGAQLNLDHLLLELVGFGWFESASSIKSRDAAGDYTPYLNGNGIQMFGLSLRAGWSEWTPRDRH